MRRSNMFSNSLVVGNSMCDIERIQNIIDDCDIDGTNNRGTTVINEALIVTWQVSDEFFGETYHFQAVVAINDDFDDDFRETYIIFLYDQLNLTYSSLDFQTGFINGLYTVNYDRQWAAACPFGNGISFLSNIHQKSNCRCGNWMKGIYVFKTRDNIVDVPLAPIDADYTNDYLLNPCTMTETEFLATCASDITTDNLRTFQQNCRPSRQPQDTCYELTYCEQTENGTSGFKMTIVFEFPAFDGYVFLNYNAYLSSRTVVEETGPMCRGVLTNLEGFHFCLTLTGDKAGTMPCGMTLVSGSPDVIHFAVLLYDRAEKHGSDILKPGMFVLQGTCSDEDLPNSISNSVKTGGIPSYEPQKISGRRVDMFVNNARRWNPTDTSSTIPFGTVVDLGQDLFLGVGYDYGSPSFTAGVEPYGVYVKDCFVANNAHFKDDSEGSTEGTNRRRQLIGSNGCVPAALTPGKAFYIQDNFEKVYEDSSQGASSYNFVQMSGKLDAAFWIIGEPNTIYFRCTVGFCRNQNFKENSKCTNSCLNKFIDYDPNGKRRRRSENKTQIKEYPDIMIETSLTINTKRDKTDEQRQGECVNFTVAMVTLVVLTMILIVAFGVSVLLFLKLQTRLVKRQRRL
ncbi:uncharacterized protein LOC128552533 [Mercenaria mercenaria]|uniref:uncharacterized protein LOC128552533 n=1 Tax=Mercenaria mercenaria TaxID=6596 RepID=UPI00234F2044|nr:uncharacterized protein LOC128552533 [Mercenaria mercenaria]